MLIKENNKTQILNSKSLCCVCSSKTTNDSNLKFKQIISEIQYAEVKF